MRIIRAMRITLGLLAVLLASGAAVRAAEKPSLDELWKQIYDRPERLATLDHPAIVYLDIQHAAIIRAGWTKLADPLKKAHTFTMRERFKTLSGLDCLVVHRDEVTGADLDRPQIKAILISGRSTTDVPPRDEPFFDLIRQTKIPILGFCGGGQLIGKASGTPLVSLRRLKPGEPDPSPTYHPGIFKEKGYLKVQILQADPLFAGLSPEPVFKQSHAFQLSDVPPGFDLLASSPACRVQAIKHRDRLVYGVQFHPEGYDQSHPDGRTLLENFFRLALGKR